MCRWGKDRGGNLGGSEVCEDGQRDSVTPIRKVDIQSVKL